MGIFRGKGSILSSKQVSVIAILGLLMILTLSGCQMVKETFGKEYRMIDDFFEQLEADRMFSVEEAAAEQGISSEELADKQIYLDQMVADLHVAKDDLKNGLRNVEALQKEFGTNLSVESYVEQTLTQFRISYRENLEKASGGVVTLRSTEVDRGIIGTIWHFIRNHWLISLVVFGVIGSIPEVIGDIISGMKKKSSSQPKT